MAELKVNKRSRNKHVCKNVYESSVIKYQGDRRGKKHKNLQQIKTVNIKIYCMGI